MKLLKDVQNLIQVVDQESKKVWDPTREWGWGIFQHSDGYGSLESPTSLGGDVPSTHQEDLGLSRPDAQKCHTGVPWQRESPSGRVMRK